MHRKSANPHAGAPLLFSLVALLSSCASPKSPVETEALRVHTANELRSEGWVPFAELPAEDQEALARMLGPELNLLLNQRLLVKRGVDSTATPILKGH